MYTPKTLMQFFKINLSEWKQNMYLKIYNTNFKNK